MDHWGVGGQRLGIWVNSHIGSKEHDMRLKLSRLNVVIFKSSLRKKIFLGNGFLL